MILFVLLIVPMLVLLCTIIEKTAGFETAVLFFLAVVSFVALCMFWATT